MAPLVNRLFDGLASNSAGRLRFAAAYSVRPISGRLDHLLAGPAVDRAAQRLEVGLLGAPLGQVRESPLGEAVRGLHHRPVAVSMGAGLAHHPRAMLRIDASISAHPDLREPHPAHGARLAVAHLQRHTDAANVAVAVVRQAALAGEETLHRRQRDAPEVAWSGPLEEPEGHPSSFNLRITNALHAFGQGAGAVAR